MAPTGTNNIVNLAVRGAQGLFAIIVLGISAGLIADEAGSDGKMGYNLFVSLWTLVIVIPVSLVAARFVQMLAAPIVALVLEALSWIFWLAAWASAAATLHGSEGHYDHSSKGALVAFGVLEWILFCYTLYVAVMAFLDTSRGSGGKGASNGV